MNIARWLRDCWHGWLTTAFDNEHRPAYRAFLTAATAWRIPAAIHHHRRAATVRARTGKDTA
jgi:hypothetical protein